MNLKQFQLSFVNNKPSAPNRLAPQARYSRAHQIKPGVAQLKNAASKQVFKTPVAPPVYRAQPNPKAIQQKTTTPTTNRIGPPNHRNAVQLSRIPNASPIHKTAPKRVVQMKSVATNPKGQIRVPQPSGNRPPTTFARPRTIQLLKVKEMTKAYVRHPDGDEQVAVHNKVQALLAKHAEEDVGDDMEKARLKLASLVLRNQGGQPTFEFKMMAYFLGLRGDAPSSIFSGMGSLGISGGRLRGRPGFLWSAFDLDKSKGAPGRAYRHRSPWHYIEDFLNIIWRRYGADEIRSIYKSVYQRVPSSIALEADKILAKFRGSKAEYTALWLAIVLNSARSNLWLGPSKENISINSSAYHLKRWTKQLDDKEISLSEYRAKVASAKCGSRKASEVRAHILKIIDESVSEKDRVTAVVSLVMKHCISRLEIDLPDEAERESSPHHMRIFEIAHEIGGLADRLHIIEALLDLEPDRRRSRSRSPEPDSRKRERSRSPDLDSPYYPTKRVMGWGPTVEVDSMDDAVNRSWNIGDVFQLPDGRRYGVVANHHAYTPFMKGELWFLLRGG